MLQHKYTRLTEQFVATLNMSPKVVEELVINQRSIGRVVDTISITNELIGELFRFADNITVNIITPWTIEIAKGADDMYKVFGLPRLTLPVIVVFNNVIVGTHQCTEELIFGILSVTSFSDVFSFYLEDTVNILNAITLEDIQGNYINNFSTFNKFVNRRYSATLPIDDITFNSIDVIQGVITACNWIGRDPHDFIQDIKQDNIPLDF